MTQKPSPPALAAALLPWLFVLLWSTGFIGAKFGLPYVEPLTFLTLRYAIVLVLMAAVALVLRAPWPRSARQWLHIGGQGCSCMACTWPACSRPSPTACLRA